VLPPPRDLQPGLPPQAIDPLDCEPLARFLDCSLERAAALTRIDILAQAHRLLVIAVWLGCSCSLGIARWVDRG
jgi:hypothetical protein